MTDTLSAVSDAEMRQGSPTSNFGSDTSAVSGRLGTSASGELRHALFKFDVSSIPSGSSINSVTLLVNVTRVPNGGVASMFEVRRVLQDWTEDNVSWSNRLAGTTWNAAGATGIGDTVTIGSASTFVSDLGPYLFDSTTTLMSDVQTWVNNPDANHGWLLISQDEESDKTARHFGTRESGDSAPVLTVDYTAAIPPSIFNAGRVGNGQFRFLFSAQMGHTYTVETASSIPSTNWTVLTNFAVPSSNTILGLTNSIGASNKFYRVRTP